MRTDGQGRATARVADLNGVAGTVALVDDRVGRSTTVALSHVVPAPHTVPHVSNLRVGLDLRSRVRLQISSGGTGVPAGAVASLRLHSVTGTVITVDPRRRRTLTLASRITRLTAGTLSPQRVTWSVSSISAGPGVALTTARPRFDPLGQAVWQLRLHPVHGQVQVQTVPATAGVAFLLEGASFSTGPNGVATAPVNDLNNLEQRLQLDSPAAGPDTVQMRDIRKLPPLAVHQRRLLVALSVSRPVALRFVDSNRRPIDPNRISEVELLGGGSKVQLSGLQAQAPVMLPARLATQAGGGWTAATRCSPANKPSTRPAPAHTPCNWPSST